jgi:hypothetical protein
MTAEPHVACEAGEDGAVMAFFAFELASIGVLPESADSGRSFTADLLERQVDFINTLAGRGPGRTFETRFLARPAGGDPHRGSVTVALRVGVQGESREEAGRLAGETRHSIWPNLLSLSDVYEWRPVADEKRYAEIFAPFRGDGTIHAAELVRREARVLLDKGDKKGGGLVGFWRHPVEEEKPPPKARGTYAVFPFVPTTSPLDRLFSVLLLQPAPVAVSVLLVPTRIEKEERAFLRAKVAFCERFIQLPVSGAVSDVDKFSPPLKSQAQALIHRYLHDLYTLSDAPFFLRVLAASSAPLSDGLMDALGVTVTGHVCPSQPGAGGDFHDHFVGGYDWAVASEEAGRASVLDGMDRLRTGSWIPSLAPDLAKRIRYLVDARQANAAFRFPLPRPTGFPGLTTRLAATLPPPSNLPDEGVLAGENVHAGVVNPVRLLRDDRRRHMYVVGQTGTGKSSLFLSMILQDIRNGEGVGVIDPHGELIEEILPRIPRGRKEDVVYVNPEDREYSIGLNLLEHRNASEKDFAVNQILEIFDKLYDMSVMGGPIFELYMRNAVLLAMADPDTGSTLAEVQRIFSNKEFRLHKLSRCDDPFVVEFWSKTAKEATGDMKLESIAPYIVAKLSRFIYNDLIRPIVVQQKSQIRIREIMDGRKILLVDLCKGKLGETNSSFLGMILTSLILRATFERTDAPDREALADFYLYVDEFHNLATSSFVSILAEARKYRLNLIVTNQYLHQIPEAIQDAIIGNVGTLLAFRLGMKDAMILEREFLPAVGRRDLINLPNFNAYVSTLVRGEAAKPFSLRTLKDDSAWEDVLPAVIRQSSRRLYAKPKASVEAEVKERWARIYDGPDAG